VIDWFKLWPILVTLVGLIGAAFTLKADVDSIKEAIGPPGSLPVIELKVEQQTERIKRLETLLERQDDERGKMLDTLRSGQEKIDSLIELLLMERQETERRTPRLKPSVPRTSALWRGLRWS
jgi:hypothetical protein